jgi:hypothetical protein
MLGSSYVGKIYGKAARSFCREGNGLGNLVFVGLVIGQLVHAASPFRLALFILGVLGMGEAYTLAYFLLKGGGQS